MLFGYAPSVIRQYLLDNHLIDSRTLAASDPWAIYNAAKAFNVTGPELDAAVPEWAATGLSAQQWLAQSGLYLSGEGAAVAPAPAIAPTVNVSVPPAVNNYYPAATQQSYVAPPSYSVAPTYAAPQVQNGFANDTGQSFVPSSGGGGIDPATIIQFEDSAGMTTPGPSIGLDLKNPYVIGGLGALLILMLNNKKKAH